MIEIVDMGEPEVSLELGLQVVQELRKVRQEMYPVCLFHNIDFRELVEKHEPRYGNSSSDFANLQPSDQPCNVRSGREGCQVSLRSSDL